MINIRIATVRDLDQLQQLSRATFYDSFAAYNTQENMAHYLAHQLSSEQLRSELENPASAFYFVHDGETNIGYIKLNWAAAQTDEHDDQTIEIERIYVIKDWKGKGIGKLLMEHAISIAKESHLKAVWLAVWEHNTHAIAFYRHFGFQPFKTHIFMLGDDPQTDILMKLELVPHLA